MKGSECPKALLTADATGSKTSYTWQPWPCVALRSTSRERVADLK